MRDENVRLLFSTIDDFMETQASPSTSLPEQFPWLINIIPRRLQWFRPKAERVFKKTIGYSGRLDSCTEHLKADCRKSRVYASFLDDLDKRIKQGQDPKCFARDMTDLATKYGFDDAQKYFCGKAD